MLSVPFKVAVRVQPDHSSVNNKTVSVQKDKGIITVANEAGFHNKEKFHFEFVYEENDNVDKIYTETAKPLVEKALQGFNVAILTYGQSHSGKTHTMFGSETKQGIVSMAVEDIFRHIATNEQTRFFIVRIALLEVYNERLEDLSAVEEKAQFCHKSLRLRETSSGFMFVENLFEEICGDASSAQAVVNRALARRHNSHVLCRVIIESQNIADVEDTSFSELIFVVTAGSESSNYVNSRKHSRKEKEEKTVINRSLLMLSLVTQQLSEGRPPNYRNSMLTRILQNGFGGNSYTSIICSISPKVGDYKQTVSTLKFASMAKLVKSRPHLNGNITDSAIMPRLGLRSATLQRRLSKSGTSMCNAASSTSSEVSREADESKPKDIQKKLMSEIFAEPLPKVENSEIVDSEQNCSEPIFQSSIRRRMSWLKRPDGHPVVKLITGDCVKDMDGNEKTCSEENNPEIVLDDLFVVDEEGRKSLSSICSSHLEDDVDSDNNNNHKATANLLVPDKEKKPRSKLEFVVGDSEEERCSNPGSDRSSYGFDQSRYVSRGAYDAVIGRMKAMKQAVIARMPAAAATEINTDDEFEVVLEKLCESLSMDH